MATQLYLLPIYKAKEYDEDYHARFFPHRLEKSRQLRMEDDRLRTLGGSILLHEVLGLDEKRLVILPGGKPAAPSLGRQFNLSHSGEYAVLAVSDFPVGVDIEGSSLQHIKVANRVYTSEELSWMNEKPKKRFTLLWTMKEAVSKALGLGLRLPFREFDVLPLLRGEGLPLRGATLYGRSLPLPGYSLSVCTAGELGKVTIETL